LPANTEVSASSSFGTASVTASYGLAPSPGLFATGTGSGELSGQANITYQYFIELTGPSGTVPLTVNTTVPSGTVPLTVNTTGSAVGGSGSEAIVGLTNTTDFSVPYLVYTSDGAVSVFDNGFTENSSGSFNRSDVVNIAADEVYRVTLVVQVFADSSNPQETASVDPYFQFPVGYSLDISSGVGNSPAAATPIPAALPLFAGGLGIVGFLAKRRKNSKRFLAAA
jgi:hypothetical protein